MSNLEQVLREILIWQNDDPDQNTRYAYYGQFASQLEHGRNAVELESGFAYKVEQTYEPDSTTIIFSVNGDFYGIDGDTSSWDGTEWDGTPYEVVRKQITKFEYTRA
jgi:hypothetical protein